MCGIAGFIGFNNNLELAHKANEIQKHRGPDNQSVWSDSFIAFAHQRLSIIDLSESANQPFEKHEFIIVYNGEIYNFNQLKKVLRNNFDVKFKTASDTEVILEMYRIHKEKCLDFFEGMFAFCIYNKLTHALFIARDHFGIKPLFYAYNNKRFAFASELKTLTNLPGFTKEIETKALISSVNYLSVSGNESMFKNRTKIPPAHFITVNKHLKINKKRYWTLPLNIFEFSEKELIEKLTAEVENSVSKHLISDVPVSSFLSGGLDSSLISVIANKISSPLSTYTIATENRDKQVEKMPDDEKYASKLAQLYGFDSNEIVIKPKILDILPKMIYHLDEPIGDPAAINTFLICKAAKDNGIKVLLSGMGADELFFGYRRQKAILYALQFNKIPYFLRYPLNAITQYLPVMIGNNGLRLVRWTKRFLRLTGMTADKTNMQSLSYFTKKELNALIKENHTKEIDAMYQEHNDYFNCRYPDDLINKICFTDVNMFMTNHNLTYTDRSSMAASVEVRVPYIDKKMVEFAMQIRGKYKFANKETKYILKKSAEKWLPGEIIYRPKAAFGAPIRSWISNDLKEMVDDLLSENTIKKRGLFDYTTVKKMIEQDRKGKNDYAYQIYQLLTIEIWMQQFYDA